MKINPIGIDSYRQAMERPQVEKRPDADNKPQVNQSERVNITDRTDRVGSKLAVRLKPGTFVDMLSTEEKKAVELAFEKYAGAGRTYAKNGANETVRAGSLVDVKL
ncbi:MAG: hypothetical protein CVT49_02710 [candidate division Zixibacteria bacterium HGW-Zixibacteria-1]|nr:MAG: hypothetical protein CVT49_02710 [candidate division Zixibacteria bacterium HGW-Zixibacteria-1]